MSKRRTVQAGDLFRYRDEYEDTVWVVVEKAASADSMYWTLRKLDSISEQCWDTEDNLLCHGCWSKLA